MQELINEINLFLSSNPIFKHIIVGLILLIIGLVAYLIITKLIVKLLSIISARSNLDFEDIIKDKQLFRGLGLIAGLTIIYFGVRLVYPDMDAFLDKYAIIKIALIILGIILISSFSYFFVKRIILKLVHYFTRKTKFDWDDVLREKGVFSSLAYFAPISIIYLGVLIFSKDLGTGLSSVIMNIALAGIVIVVILTLEKLIGAGQVIYNSLPIAKKRPINSYVQLAKIILYAVGAIVAGSFLFGKDPAGVFVGLGAFMAVILIIFRDTILSFVASVQISSYDVVRKGDWIEVPQFGANGTVIDMQLHLVRVQNFDKTIVTIPIHALVDNSFKNWRGMQESGGRRIMRSIYIDQTSVKFCNDKMLKKYENIQILKDYIQRKKTEVEEYNKNNSIDPNRTINGRQLTNIGTFRAYVFEYLHHHPRIREDMTFLVRQLDPTPEGLPIQIYVFTDTTVWGEYEGIQSDIFDHIISSVGEFDLKLFQNPTGNDFKNAFVEMSEGMSEEKN